MPTGGVNKAAEPTAVGLRIERGRLAVELDDEREVSVPLDRYPTLHRARPAQRRAWRLIGRGVGFHWPDLDLSVRGLVSGLPEVIPAPPPRPGAGRRAAAGRRKAQATVR
jgi:hypothetical protein